MLTQKVNCKINLGLHIVRKREDGFHELRTVFYPTDFFTDTLTLEECDQEMEFVCHSQQDLGDSEHNLCVKAFRLLQKDYNIRGVRITLNKGIPSGAGLGGGSADAAFTLRMLDQLFQLNLSTEQLIDYAAMLGSDVPFFIENRPMYATGRGEVLAPINLDLSNYDIRIVKPDISVSTKEAYAGVAPKMPTSELSSDILLPIEHWRGRIHNDFEDSIFLKHPSLQKLKQDFYEKGALYAAMSGSGTAVFGIFQR